MNESDIATLLLTNLDYVVVDYISESLKVIGESFDSSNQAEGEILPVVIKHQRLQAPKDRETQ